MESAINSLPESELKDDLKALFNTMWHSCPLLRAMDQDRTHLSHYLIESSRVQGNQRHTAFAADCGRVDYLTLMHKKKFPIDWSTFDAAAEGGSLDCVKFVQNILGVPVNEYKNIRCILNLVAQLGYAQILEFLLAHTKTRDVRDYEWIVLDTAQKGHVDCLRVLHRAGAPMTWLSFSCAHWLNSFTLEVIQYIHEELGFQFDEKTVEWAAHTMPHSVLRYIIERGGTFDVNNLFIVVLHKDDLIALTYLVEERNLHVDGLFIARYVYGTNIGPQCVLYLRARGLL